jgi:UDP-N-acetyl-D-glucosamine dehydrogenase
MTKERDILLSKIGSRRAKVGVIGLGYVGLPLAVGFAKAGFPTFGIDVDDRKVAALNAGRFYVLDVPFAELTDASLGKADCVMIVTDHAAYDWDRLRPSVRAFVDCRNALKK